MYMGEFLETDVASDEFLVDSKERWRLVTRVDSTIAYSVKERMHKGRITREEWIKQTSSYPECWEVC